MALAAGALVRAVATATPPPPGMASYVLAASPVFLANLGLSLALVKAVAGYFLTSAERRIAGKIVRAARLSATNSLLASGPGASGPEVLARVATRCVELEQGVRLGVLGGVRAVCQLVPLGAAMILLSPSLSVTAILALVLFGFSAAGAHRKWRLQSRAAQQHAERLHEEIHELVSHVDLWRSFGAGARIRAAIDAASARVNEAEARVAAGRAALSGGNEVLAAAALVLAIAFADRDGSAGLLAFAGVFFMAYRPLRDAGDARAWLDHGCEALAALENVAKAPVDSAAPMMLDARPELGAVENWGAPERLGLESFGAAARGPRTSFSLAPGSTNVIRGHTGSGKTTLFRALLGVEPAVGALSYGRRDLTRAPVGPDTRPFAWVPQDAPVLTATLRDNVGLAARDEGGVDRAIQTVGLGALDEALGSALLGPGGRSVSGGQRRLIAIARALATGQPVLLLDEPTEGLDHESRDRIVEALRRLKGSRTVVVATHRTDLDAIADATIELGEHAALAAE